ncbi:MAG: alpha/beta hydrolase [Myxococcota bacterium]|nr:alpha/beta hydrolase [Myxococcota bacterium]
MVRPGATAREARRPVASAASGASSVRHHYRTVDNVRLHWAELGEKSNRTPVLLLHGLNDSHLTWMRVAPELARDRRVLLLDLPGHGLSERPDASYALAWYARVIALWLEALKIDQVDIVGHSLGGGIAQVLLCECRSRIRRLVLAAPGGLGQDIAFVLRLASLPIVVERFGQPFMAAGTRLALGRWGARLAAEHVAGVGAMNARGGTARAFSRTVRDLIDWRGQRHSFFQRAHEIAELPPILLLWGDRDAIIPVAHGENMARSVEGVRFLILAGCGHYLHHDDPESFLQAVREGLDAPSWPTMRFCSAESPGRTKGGSAVLRDESPARNQAVTSQGGALRGLRVGGGES